MMMREDGGLVSQTRDRTRQMGKMEDLSTMGKDDDGGQWIEHRPGTEHDHNSHRQKIDFDG